MERGLIGQSRLEETPAQAVEDRVRRLVHDDVVAQARVDRRIVLVLGGHVSEQHRAVFPRVVGVRLGEGVRHEVQVVTGEAPREPPAERGLERGEGLRSRAVDLLRVEGLVGQQDLVGCCRIGVFIHERGMLAVLVDGDVVVDDVQAGAARPVLDARPRHFHLRGQDPAVVTGDRGILGDQPEGDVRARRVGSLGELDGVVHLGPSWMRSVRRGAPVARRLGTQCSRQTGAMRLRT